MSLQNELKTILLVEDEALIAINEESILEKNGYQVKTVYDAEAAINATDEIDIDLILMDIDLGEGEMDGTEAAEAILIRHDVPIVFLSSHTEPEIVEKTEGITSYGYIVKTSGETVLIASIKMAFRLFEAKQEEKTKEELLKQSEYKFRKIFDSTNEAIFITDMQGSIIEVNDTACKRLGYTIDELLRMSAADIDDPESAPLVPKRLELIDKDEKLVFEAAHKRKDGTTFPVEINCRKILCDHTECILHVARDISNRKQAKKLLQAIPDMMFLLDRNGRYIDYKADSAAVLDVTPEAFLGKTVKEVLPKEIAEQIMYYMGETFRTKQTQLFYHDMALNNERYTFETRMTLVDEGHVVSIARDITEQKRTEEERNTYYNLLTSIIGAVDSLLMVIDKQHRIHFCNWKDHEWVPKDKRGKRPYCYKVMKHYSAPCDNCQPMKTFEDGKTRWYEDQNPLDGSLKEISVIPIFGRNGEVEYVLENVRDVTEQKKSERRLKTILDKLPIPIVISSGNMEEVESLNTKFKQLFGYTEKDIPDVFHWFEKAYPDEEYRKEVQAKWRRRIQAAAETKSEIEPISVYITGKDGTVLYVSVRAFSSGDLHIIAFIDLTDIKKLQKDLENSLEEKNFLLRELNHRVKNNLLMVSSLINLKDQALGELVELSDLARQIDAIRFIHEKLYTSKDVTHIDVTGYVGDLLQAVFSFSTKHVSIEKNIEIPSLHPRTAIPIGLIINEIATNAIKHGFTAKEESRFSVILKKDKKKSSFILTLSNNGKPFPEHIELDNPETLGFRLITALVSQLHGTIEIKRKPHPVFTIRFPA